MLKIDAECGAIEAERDDELKAGRSMEGRRLLDADLSNSKNHSLKHVVSILVSYLFLLEFLDEKDYLRRHPLIVYLKSVTLRQPQKRHQEH